jgi:PAS domain S-box-containing protein
MSSAYRNANLAFLSGGGETGALLRAFDWEGSPLGPPDTWPQSLRTVVSLMLVSRQPVYIAWGPQLTSLYNDQYIPVLGTKHPHGLGKPYRELWSELWADIEPVVSATMRGESQLFVDTPLPLAGRHTAVSWFSFSYTPIRDEDGAVAGFFCAALETTETVLAARHIETERRRFAQLFEQAPTFMALLRGPEHRFELANPGYMQLVGHREVIGRTVAEALPEAVGQGFIGLLDGVYRDGKPFAGTGLKFAVQPIPDGPVNERFVDLVYQPIKDEDGVVSGIFVEGVDVTERVEGNLALAQSEARLRSLNADLERQVLERSQERGLMWKMSLDLLSVVTHAGYFETTNPAWQTVLGWTAQELAGTHYAQLVHPDDLERSQATFSDMVDGVPLGQFENRYRSSAGDYRSISWSTVAEGGKFYCTGRDVTEQKARQAELDHAQESLRQAQKMEAVGQLTGGLAHDFNNLLAGIGGSMELIQLRVSQGRVKELDRYINSAQGSVRRAAALTHRLLAFSRRQTLDPKVIDVNRLIAGIEDLLRRTMGPAITVEVVTAAGLWSACVDAPQLENALLNLAINARDAMPEGGRLTIETANRRLDERMAREQQLPAGDYLAVSVSDTGTGMTADTAARAFEPFFTTKPLGMGTGLGLSMVYGFARQSEGQVRIYSELNLGTTMCIYLPRHLGRAGAEVIDTPKHFVPMTQGKTVLIVDDEPTVRMLVVEALSEIGFDTLEAEAGAQGLKILQSNRRIDLLVTDVGLPGGMNGRQLADAARVDRPDLKVLFITGYAENAALGSGHLEPGMGVLTKPFTLDALGDRVRELAST